MSCPEEEVLGASYLTWQQELLQRVRLWDCFVQVSESSIVARGGLSLLSLQACKDLMEENSYGRWGMGEITNDLKDSMELRVPRSESQRTQKLAHGRVREGERKGTWPRWARWGKDAPYWHITLE